MENSRKNAERVSEILKKIGSQDGVIKLDGAWDLSVFYTQRDANMIVIEMSASERINGDTVVDPLMKIELLLDGNGEIVEAHPVYYQSQTPLAEIEIYSKDNPDCWNPQLYEKPGQLDERLSNWLDSIDMQGYLKLGSIEII